MPDSRLKYHSMITVYCVQIQDTAVWGTIHVHLEHGFAPPHVGGAHIHIGSERKHRFS